MCGMSSRSKTVRSSRICATPWERCRPNSAGRSSLPRVAAITDAGERDLGAPLGRGRTAALFAADLPHVRRIELRRGDQITERVTLL